MKSYIETFDDGPGGWFGWIDNARGPKRLEQGESTVTSRSPWWIDYNHAPPGAGYMHLLYMLFTSGHPGEKDYPVWRGKLPEGYVTLDEVRINFP